MKMKDVIQTAAALIGSITAFRIARAAAFAARGYRGVGSEIFVPLIVYIAVFKMTGMAVDAVRRSHEKRIRRKTVCRKILGKEDFRRTV